MSWTAFKASSRKFLVAFAALLLAAAALIPGAGNRTVSANSPEADFAADPASLGAIPDATGTGCGLATVGQRDVTFTVSGVSAPITNVAISVTGTHTWVADLTLTLIAPGGAQQAVILKNTGSTTATSCGDSSDFAGPYVYSDSAPASPTYWDAAATAGATVPVAAGSYRSTAPLTGAVTTITPNFTGVANPNGQWILRVTDSGGGDTGSITAATLTVTGSGGPTPTPTPTPTATPTPAPDYPLDYNGDGKSDFSVVRANGPAATDTVTWFNFWNGVGPQPPVTWGLVSDEYVPADYDGDGKDDIAVYRAGSPSTWYILRSQTSTVRIDNFGQTGDDPSIVGDYNGDNKDDIAVYRINPTAGGTNTWFYKPENAFYTSVTFGINSGGGGDFPAPGDYDGDGKNDFVVQRNQAGTGVFYELLSSNVFTSINFGNGTEAIAPGDYDGDNKTDIMLVSAVGGNYQWSFRSSINGSTVTDTWGSAASNDIPVVGNYCGDNRFDYGVWRPTNPATFFAMNPVTRTICTQNWGTGTTDLPVGVEFIH